MPLSEKDKALVFENRGANPGTHVLIIGIGEYPHLIRGENENTAIAEGMEQLDAPPISARAVAKWFLDNFENPERPLASLAMVLSDPKSARFRHRAATEVAHDLPKGTADDVDSAIQAWVTRASSNKDNMTIFFFSGHGVSAAVSILLLRDFGAKPLHRFDGALNLALFLNAMASMLPEYQLFLIDACRVPTSLADSVLGTPVLGRMGLTPQDLGVRGGTPAKQSQHHSSSLLAPSWGRILGGSLYTEALLEALDGGAAQPNLGWWIGTHGLQTALAAYVARLAATEKVEQHPDVGRMALFKVHQPAKEKIKVPLYVTSAPKEALRRARVEARLGQKISAYFDPKKHKPLDEWRVRLPIREHTLAAWFHAPAEYEDEPPQVVVIAPPEIPFEFQFRRKA